MKKIIQIILFITLFFITSNECYAKTNYIKLGDAIPNVRLHLKTPNVEKNKNMYQIINQDTNELVYCIEPGIMLNNGSFTEYQEINKFPIAITEEDWNQISLIAFFGYQHNDRTDIKWYVATQMMIWDYLLKDTGEIYFINDANEKISLYEEEMQEIQADIDNRAVLPSFTTSDYTVKNQYTIKLNEELILEDTNNVLKNFKISPNNTLINPKVDGNKFSIKAEYPVSGESYVSFMQDYNASDIPKLFYSANSQAVMSRGNVGCPVGFLNIKVLYPSFKLIKRDNESLKPLKGAKFSIYYEDGSLYDTFTTNELGEINLEEIYFGNYYLQEIEAPYGYKLNSDKIYFEVKDQDIEIVTENEKILKQINVEKYLETYDKKYILEPNAKFAIYNEKTNELIMEKETDEFGKLSFTLPYGKYKIVQTKGQEGFLFIDDFIIEINDNTKENETIILKNKEITGNLKITKKDADNKTLIKESTKFRLFNVDQNKYFALDNQDIFETKKGILYLENIPYGKYLLEEIESPNGYRKSFEKWEINITKENETFTLEVFNESKKGNLEILKIDSLTKEPLINIKFGLYNQNKELIQELYTNNEGKIILNNLKIGNYYLKELLTQENYELNSEEIKIEIKDNITTTLTLENRMKIEVPKTGVEEFLITMLICSLMLLGGVYLCNYGKEK